jgi:hypothetical protein
MAEEPGTSAGAVGWEPASVTLESNTKPVLVAASVPTVVAPETTPATSDGTANGSVVVA